MSRTSTWIGASCACVVGVVVATQCSRGSRPAAPAPEVRGAYRPTRDRPATPRPALAAASGEGAGALSPELEQRLRASRMVMSAPSPASPAPAGPAPGPPDPELLRRRQVALIGWTREAQHLLDDCVARPDALREPVALEVFFAPGAGAPLAPAVISVPVDELRRLWRDTDADALQGCLDRMRTLALAIPGADGAAGALPAAERVVVRL